VQRFVTTCRPSLLECEEESPTSARLRIESGRGGETGTEENQSGIYVSFFFFNFKSKLPKPSLFSLPLTDRKAALEAVVKSLGPGFVAEFNKHKSLRAAAQGSWGSGKSPPSHGAAGKTPRSTKKPLKTSGSAKASKKDAPSTPGSGSSSPETDDAPEGKEVEEEEEDLPAGTSGPCPPYNRVSF